MKHLYNGQIYNLFFLSDEQKVKYAFRIRIAKDKALNHFLKFHGIYDYLYQLLSCKSGTIDSKVELDIVYTLATKIFDQFSFFCIMLFDEFDAITQNENRTPWKSHWLATTP